MKNFNVDALISAAQHNIDNLDKLLSLLTFLKTLEEDRDNSILRPYRESLAELIREDIVNLWDNKQPFPRSEAERAVDALPYWMTQMMKDKAKRRREADNE